MEHEMLKVGRLKVEADKCLVSLWIDMIELELDELIIFIRERCWKWDVKGVNFICVQRIIYFFDNFFESGKKLKHKVCFSFRLKLWIREKLCKSRMFHF